MEIDDIEVVGDERVGHGGYLLLRRMRMRMLLSDGSRTPVGTWDYVERPSGLDAVVIALWRRGEGGRVEVLLRSGLRVPVRFGRPHEPPREHFPELVAGILEPGDEPRRRAADEALEEAGLRISPEAVEPLGPASFPTPGMCAEMFHFVACEVPSGKAGTPHGDGSPFEEGAVLEWVELGEALRRCSQGEIQDMKTEVGLRRLRERFKER